MAFKIVYKSNLPSPKPLYKKLKPLIIILEFDLFKDKFSEKCMPSNMADEEEDPVVHEV